MKGRIIDANNHELELENLTTRLDTVLFELRGAREAAASLTTCTGDCVLLAHGLGDLLHDIDEASRRVRSAVNGVDLALRRGIDHNCSD